MIRTTKFVAQGLKDDRGTPNRLLLSQLLVLLSTGVLAICFLLPLPAHSQGKPEKVRIAYPTISITLAPLWLAKDTGLFEQEGLDVEPTYIRGGTTIVQAVIGGNVQIGYAGVPPILSAMARGAPLVVVAVLNNKMDYLIVSRTPVRQPSELNGKKFAISSFGSSSEFAARLGLEKVGADPSKVTMVQVGGSPDRIVALKTGAVDATILSATDFVETSGLGFHTLVDLSKSDIDYPFNVFFALRSFATDKRAAISGTLRGFVRAVRFLRGEKEEALKVVAKRLRNANMDVLRAQWHHVAFEYFGEDLYPTEAGFALAMKEMQGKTGPLRFSEMIDVSHLDELSRSGFFNQAKRSR
jgi:ABC-type nitrate/sulfonate/bicarbonate transport system substrate-binding protein